MQVLGGKNQIDSALFVVWGVRRYRDLSPIIPVKYGWLTTQTSHPRQTSPSWSLFERKWPRWVLPLLPSNKIPTLLSSLTDRAEPIGGILLQDAEGLSL